MSIGQKLFFVFGFFSSWCQDYLTSPFFDRCKKDVENESKSKSQPKPKRRNPTVRLAFYAQIPLCDQNGDPTEDYMDLIVASNPISCSQPEGQPEILRISLHEGSPEGGDEMFIIGKWPFSRRNSQKNFEKFFRIFFRIFLKWIFRQKFQQKLPSGFCSRDDGVGGCCRYQQHIYNKRAFGGDDAEIFRSRSRKGHLRQSSHTR